MLLEQAFFNCNIRYLKLIIKIKTLIRNIIRSGLDENIAKCNIVQIFNFYCAKSTQTSHQTSIFIFLLIKKYTKSHEV